MSRHPWGRRKRGNRHRRLHSAYWRGKRYMGPNRALNMTSQLNIDPMVRGPSRAEARADPTTSAARKVRILPMGYSIRAENRFDRLLEQPGDREGQRETGVILPGLDGVDGLPGHLEPLRQIGLRPGPLGPQHPETIGHRYFRRTISWPMAQLKNRTIQSQDQDSAMPVLGTTSNLASSP